MARPHPRRWAILSALLTLLWSTSAWCQRTLLDTPDLNSSIRLGIPVLNEDPYAEPADSTSLSGRLNRGPLWHDVYSPGLPPPSKDLSIGGLSRLREPGANKPWTIDYVYFGRSGVSDPGTSVRLSEIGVNYKMRFPLFDGRLNMTVRPSFDVLFLAGPSAAGPAGTPPVIPEQLYKTAVDVQADLQITEIFGISAGIAPGFWTDYIKIDASDIRLPARVLGTFRVNDNLFIAAGVIYTDNLRRNLLPGVGILWDVWERWRLEIMWPRSRVIYRFHENLQFYGVIERGGTTYNLRVLDRDEDFEYRDLRVMFGAQFDNWERASLFVEAGAAFQRKFRFEIQPDFDLTTSFVLRAGIRF